MAGLLPLGRKRMPSSNTDSLPSTKSVRVTVVDEAREAGSEMTADDVVTMKRVQADHISNIFTDEEEDSKVYMSVLWNGGKVGAAFYDTFTCQVLLQLDVVETDDFEYLKRLLSQVQPHFIVTSSRQDERLLKILHCKDVEVTEDSMRRHPEVEVLPSMEFSLEVCKRRISCLANLPGMPAHFTDDEKAIYSASLLPMDSSNTVGNNNHQNSFAIVECLINDVYAYIHEYALV
jgi:DNA mismatch repair ATPase MutS